MTSKVIKNAVVYTGDSVIEEGFVRFSKTVSEVGPMTSYQEVAGEEVVDAKGQKLVPGFIDVHSHGGFGFDAMDADPVKLKKTSTRYAERGNYHVLPNDDDAIQ